MTLSSHFLDTPLTRCAVASLPVLIEARAHLIGLAAPQASRLEERIGDLLDQIVYCAGLVHAYGNKWPAGAIKKIADRACEATRECGGIMD